MLLILVFCSIIYYGLSTIYEENDVTVGSLVDYRIGENSSDCSIDAPLVEYGLSLENCLITGVASKLLFRKSFLIKYVEGDSNETLQLNLTIKPNSSYCYNYPSNHYIVPAFHDFNTSEPIVCYYNCTFTYKDNNQDIKIDTFTGIITVNFKNINVYSINVTCTDSGYTSEFQITFDAIDLNASIKYEPNFIDTYRGNSGTLLAEIDNIKYLNITPSLSGESYFNDTTGDIYFNSSILSLPTQYIITGCGEYDCTTTYVSITVRPNIDENVSYGNDILYFPVNLYHSYKPTAIGYQCQYSANLSDHIQINDDGVLSANSSNEVTLYAQITCNDTGYLYLVNLSLIIKQYYCEQDVIDGNTYPQTNTSVTAIVNCSSTQIGSYFRRCLFDNETFNGKWELPTNTCQYQVPEFSYPQDSLYLTTNVDWDGLEPIFTDIYVELWSITPDILSSHGLTFTNGIISGIPTQILEKTTFIIKTQNSAGSYNFSITITIISDSLISCTYDRSEFIFPIGYYKRYDQPTVKGTIEGFTFESDTSHNIYINSQSGYLYGHVVDIEEKSLDVIVLCINKNGNIPVPLTLHTVQYYCDEDRKDEFTYNRTKTGDRFSIGCKEGEIGEHYRDCSFDNDTLTSKWEDPFDKCELENITYFSYEFSYFYYTYRNESIPSVDGYPNHFSIASGRLPNGIILNNSTGIINGIPSESLSGSVIITASNGKSEKNATFSYVSEYKYCDDLSFGRINAGNTSVKECDDTDNYKGSQSRYCNNTLFPPSYEAINDQCLLKNPLIFEYHSQEQLNFLVFYMGIYELYSPNVNPITDTLSFTANSTFPTDIIMDETNGTIYGNYSINESTILPFQYNYDVTAHDERNLTITVNILFDRLYCPETDIYPRLPTGTLEQIECSYGGDHYFIYCPHKYEPLWEMIGFDVCPTINAPESIIYTSNSYQVSNRFPFTTEVPSVKGSYPNLTTITTTSQLPNGLTFLPSGEISGISDDNSGEYLILIVVCNIDKCINATLTLNVIYEMCTDNNQLPNSQVNTSYVLVDCELKFGGKISGFCPLEKNPTWNITEDYCLPGNFQVNGTNQLSLYIGYPEKIISTYDDTGSITSSVLDIVDELTILDISDLAYDGSGVERNYVNTITIYNADYFWRYQIQVQILRTRCLTEVLGDVTYTAFENQLFESSCPYSVQGLITRQCNEGKFPQWSNPTVICAPHQFSYPDMIFYIGFEDTFEPNYNGTKTKFQLYNTNLPENIHFDSDSGLISGTYHIEGQYTYTVRIYNTDLYYNEYASSYQVVLPKCPSITESNIFYNETIYNQIYRAECDSGFVGYILRQCSNQRLPAWNEPQIFCEGGCKSVNGWMESKLESGSFRKCTNNRYGVEESVCRSNGFEILNSNCGDNLPNNDGIQYNLNIILYMKRKLVNDDIVYLQKSISDAIKIDIRKIYIDLVKTNTNNYDNNMIRSSILKHRSSIIGDHHLKIRQDNEVINIVYLNIFLDHSEGNKMDDLNGKLSDIKDSLNNNGFDVHSISTTEPLVNVAEEKEPFTSSVAFIIIIVVIVVVIIAIILTVYIVKKRRVVKARENFQQRNKDESIRKTRSIRSDRFSESRASRAVSLSKSSNNLHRHGNSRGNINSST